MSTTNSDRDTDDALDANTSRAWPTFLSFLRPYRGRIVLGALLGIIATGTGLWTPRIVENVIERLYAGTSVMPDVALFAALTVIYLIATLTQWGMLGRTGERVVYDVRAALVGRFMRGQVAQVRERSAPDLVARTTADAPMLNLAVSGGFVAFVTSTTGVVGSIILMGVIDPVMLGVTLGAVVLLGLAMALLMPKVGRERALAQEAVGRMSTGLDGSMRALRTVKALRLEETHGAAIMANADKARRHGVKAMWAELVAYEFALGGMLIVTVAMVALGAWRVEHGHISVAALVAFIMYTQSFMVPLTSLAEGLSTIQNGLAASRRIAEAQSIELEQDDEATAGGGSDATAAIIEFDNVTARYTADDEDVVSGLSLTIPRRGHIAIVGQSGAGKSSIVSLALRFLSPRSGTITLDGVPYDHFTYPQVRERFAYVEQDSPVLPGSVRDNLSPAAPQAVDTELWDALAAVDLDSDVHEWGGLDTDLCAATMTSAERQRLAMARALLAEADVLLLDEATSAISGEAEESIIKATAVAAQRAAVVSVSSWAVPHADHVILLNDGRVHAQGSHTQLLESEPHYAALAS
jgi:ATP-binding cassette subfamily B protein